MKSDKTSHAEHKPKEASLPGTLMHEGATQVLKTEKEVFTLLQDFLLLLLIDKPQP